MRQTPHVLFEDNHLLVVDKEPGMLSQSARGSSSDLLSICKAYVKERYEKPGAVYLGLVHRLDRAVGGVMVFARTSKAAARLSEQFREHTVGKRYLALTTGLPIRGPELLDYISKDQASHRAIPLAHDAGGKEARLKWEILARMPADRAQPISKDYSSASKQELALLGIELLTGRFHQIRFQLADAGAPIAGDSKYGARFAWPGVQLALHCSELSILHPTRRESMQFRSDRLPDWATHQ